MKYGAGENGRNLEKIYTDSDSSMTKHSLTVRDANSEPQRSMGGSPGELSEELVT